MKPIIIFLSLLVSATVLAQNKSFNQKKNGTETLSGYKCNYTLFVVNGKLDSVKKEEGYYLDDRKEGPWIKYFDDGITPKLIGNYVNNRPYGDYMKFHPNSQLREKGCFIKNCLQDSIIKYYDNGQVEYEAWCNETGKEEGVVKFYHENGQLEWTFTAKNGTPVDTAYRYYNNGDLKELVIYDVAGMVIKSILYDAINPLIPETIKQKPSIPIIPEKPGFMDENNKPNGYHKIYNEKGDIWLDGIFAEGVLQDGKVYEYDDSGIILKVRVYRSDEKK